MSAIVETAIARAGLADVLAARARTGGVLSDAERDTLAARLRNVDLLVLGALADRVRALEAGDAVRIFVNVAPEPAADVVEVRGGASASAGAETGLGFLRAVAVARITGPHAARVRVRIDPTEIGLELAQVALGFGANELVGGIASKRGLPIADGAMSGTGKRSEREPMALVKKRELAGFVTRSGRRALFVGEGGALEELASETHQSAHDDEQSAGESV